jgi:hypothetical protein
MYKESEYRERCRVRGLDAAAVDAAVAAVKALETDAMDSGGTPGSITLARVERHVASLTSRGEADPSTIVALARYFVVAGVDAIAIRLLAYLSPVGVLPAMAERLRVLEGEAVRDRVMASVAIPAPGSPPEAYPPSTAAFVRALEEELGEARARQVLMWNVHGVPVEAFVEERERYLAAASVADWLAGFHERQVAVLARHAADGTLWYEQKITPRVVDFVRGNPEILSGVRDGDRILVTKIPYDPDRFLLTDDPVEKRRLACHCPLAASSISATGAGVPAIWCACSAGYEKFLFDVVFGEETEAEVLESVLAGDGRCRFSIKMPASVAARKPSLRG